VTRPIDRREAADDRRRDGDPPAPSAPRISVVVPTFDRPDRASTLLACLDGQTLDPRAFEVILVDDGSPTPLAVDAARHRFAVQVLRQENAGPAAARNLGTAHARAPLVIFLNDDAVPHADLLAVHLEAHAATSGRIAVMGAFPFTRNSLRSPFTRLLDGSNLLFDFPGLRHGKLHPWTFFWTCNISLSRTLLDEVGGFDGATFREAIVEDVELGYRLERRGVGVLYRSDAVCEHEHPMTVEAYFQRSLRLGVNIARMWRKHRDPRILYQPPGTQIGSAYLAAVVRECEASHAKAVEFVELARKWCEAVGEREIQPAERGEMLAYVRRFSMTPFLRGVVLELAGRDPGQVIAEGPTRGKLTSVIACSYNALEKTRNCVESLRRTADPAFPTEILFVDNGSTDGSAEWLAGQPDLRVIRNAANAGAPRARNQALAHAKGEQVVFLDNDVVVTPGWLERMLYHAEVDPASGCVGACADRASHGQEVEYRGATDPASLERFARERASGFHRQSRAGANLASFCLLVKRPALDAIGGFDEAFSPWGFEDDDYTFRACFAGFHSRVALDVFVHHDTYVGPKLERHSRLLKENWRKFAAKWDLGEAEYGDFSGIERTRRSGRMRDRLRVAWPEGTPAPEEPGAARAHSPLVAGGPAAVRGGERAASARVEEALGPAETVEDLRGKPVRFPARQGLEPFVRSVLLGQDYPVVFPDAFRARTVVDIGAHVGSAALFFRHAYPEARVYCFEPNPAAFQFLARNVEGEEGIEIQQVAVGPKDAEMRLFSGAHSSMQASLIASEESAAASTVVKVRSIGSLVADLALERISVLKVDTEGMELPILLALGDRLGEIDVVYLEYHSEADRLALDRLLCVHHVLFASSASEPDRGTVTYVLAESLRQWRAASRAPRYTYPKRSAASG
jgi:FkbM family methyltransferase